MRIRPIATWAAALAGVALGVTILVDAWPAREVTTAHATTEPGNDAVTPTRRDCVLDPGDPYDAGPTMPRGRYAGRCLDTRELRTLRVLSAVEARRHGLAVPPGWKAVANVRHADRFWIAVFDPAAVTDVVMQIENFPAIVPAAHTELRFRFAAGRGPRLVPQRAADPPDSTRLADLVFSVEAAYAIDGDAYDLVKGMRDFYGLVYRLTSLDDRYQQMVVKQGHHVQQVRLELTAAEGRAVLLRALDLGHRSGARAMYHTLWRNCTTELYEVLDRSVDYGLGRRALKNALFFVRTLPTMARNGLAIRGLLERGGGAWPDLAREFETSGRGRPAARRQSACNSGRPRSSYATSPFRRCRAFLETAGSPAVFS